MSDSQKQNPGSNGYNVKGDYGTPIIGLNRKYNKYCGHCGYQVLAEKRKLDQHCRNQHRDINIGFLKYDQNPVECIYSNFNQFLEGKTEELFLKPDIILNKGGRPVGSLSQQKKNQEPKKNPDKKTSTPNRNSLDDSLTLYSKS